MRVLSLSLLLGLSLPLTTMVTACDGRLDSWRFEGDWTADEQAIVLAASDEWCEATDGARCLTWDPDGSSAIGLHPERPADRGVLGYWQLETTTNAHLVRIVAHRERTDWLDSLRKTALHELGHALGCLGDWTDGETNTMSSHEGTQDGTLTERDIRCVMGLEP